MGRYQAADVVDVLADLLTSTVDRGVDNKPAVLLSSPYVRCMETVFPLAARLETIVQSTEALAEGSDTEAISLAQMYSDRIGDVVLCSHGDVIPMVLRYLSQQHHVDLGEAPRCQKASVWMIETTPTTGSTGPYGAARYLPPPGKGR